MGISAYGLVGFFAMLQAWFNLLDLGLTPTISRETSRLVAGDLRAITYRRLVNVMEIFFYLTALVGALIIFFLAGYISNEWLKVEALDVEDVVLSIQAMSVAIGLRWCSGFYRGIISGASRLVWLSGFNSIIATLRFIFIVPVFIYVGTSAPVFFLYQLIIAFFELAGLILYSYWAIIPKKSNALGIIDFGDLKRALKLSLGLAFTSIVWAIVTQTDKLILSKYISLADYGYYTLAVMAAGGVSIVSAPITTALIPKLAELEAVKDYKKLIETYRNSTQMVVVFSGSVAITMAFQAKNLIYVWTGNSELASASSGILALYAIGNGLLSIAAFPYYLQLAKGNVRLHIYGNVIFTIGYLPAIIYFSIKWGAIGASFIWMMMNLISLFGWLPLVHNKFAKGINIKWYLEDVLKIVCPMIIIGYLCSIFSVYINISSQLSSFVSILISYIIILIVAILFSNYTKGEIFKKFRFFKSA